MNPNDPMRRDEVPSYIEGTIERYESSMAKTFSVAGHAVLINEDYADLACSHIEKWFAWKSSNAAFDIDLELYVSFVPTGGLIHIGRFFELCDTLNVDRVKINVSFAKEFDFVGLEVTHERLSSVRHVSISSWQEKCLIEMLGALRGLKRLQTISIEQSEHPSYQQLYLTLAKFLASKPNLKEFQLVQKCELMDLAYDGDLESTQKLVERSMPRLFQALIELRLESLSLKLPILNNCVQDMMAKMISQLHGLKELELDYWGHVVSNHSIHLPGLPNLEKLSLKGLHEEVDPIEYSSLYPKLKALEFSSYDGTPLTPEVIDKLVARTNRFSSIESLVLLGWEIDSQSMIRLCKPLAASDTFHSLSLFGSASKSLPIEMSHDPDPQAILNHLVHSKESHQILGEVKVLVLGQGRVGKTHVRKRIFEDFPDHYERDSARTVPFEFAELTGSFSVREDQYEEITIRCWDFGGQNELQSSHRFFFQSLRCFYVLVVDVDRPPVGEESSNRLNYWLRLIGHFGGRSPVLIVPTKCDHARRLSDNEIAIQRSIDTYHCWGANVIQPVRFGFGKTIESRNEHKDAISQIISDINNRIKDVPDAATTYPRQFFRFQELVESMFEDNKSLYFTCSSPTFRDGLKQIEADLDSEGYFNSAMIESYLAILRNVGIIHWVGDLISIGQEKERALPIGTDLREKMRLSPRLHQMVFSPERLRKPLELLLSPPAEIWDGGFVSEQDMKLVLGELAGINPQEFLLLMMVNRVVFQIADPAGYFIPDLCSSKSKPASLRTLMDDNDQQFQSNQITVANLEFDFLPEWVFLRFIGENFQNIGKQRSLCFRNQVVIDLSEYGEDLEEIKFRCLLTPCYSPPLNNRPFVRIEVALADLSKFLGTDTKGPRDSIVRKICRMLDRIAEDESLPSTAKDGRLKFIDLSLPDVFRSTDEITSAFVARLRLLRDRAKRGEDYGALQKELDDLIDELLRHDAFKVKALEGTYWCYKVRDQGNKIAGVSVGTLQQERSEKKALVKSESYDATLDKLARLSIKTNYGGQLRTFYFVPSIEAT